MRGHLAASLRRSQARGERMRTRQSAVPAAHTRSLADTTSERFSGHGYFPRHTTNRKPRGGKTRVERHNQRARQEYARLLRGMQGHQCWLVTLTRRRCLDVGLRQQAWHGLRTRLTQRWPDAEAWTVVE